MLNEQEAYELAVSYAGFRQYYGASPLDERYVAAFGLLTTGWCLLQPKVAAIGLRKAAQRAITKAQKAAAESGSFAQPVRPNGGGAALFSTG